MKYIKLFTTTVPTVVVGAIVGASIGVGLTRKNENKISYLLQKHYKHKDFSNIFERENNLNSWNIEPTFSPITTKDFQKNAANNIVFPPKFQNFKIKLDNSGIITKENNDKFIGEKNNQLYVYKLKVNTSNIIDEESQFKEKILNHRHSLYDGQGQQQVIDLDYVGFRSVELSDKTFESIYQRNIKLQSGSASILDASQPIALLITNEHVVAPIEYDGFTIRSKQARFWNNPTAETFLKWYEGGKIHTLDHFDLINLFFYKKVSESPKDYLTNLSTIDVFKQESFIFDFFSNYFWVPKGFKNDNLDVNLIYFKWQEFITDVQKIIDFYKSDDSKVKNVINIFKIEESLEKLYKEFPSFVTFWNKMNKLPPVKLSNKLWKKGESNYKNLIALLWPDGFPLKSNFKGIYAATPPEGFGDISLYFYANNGPGASGGGIYNDKGELEFVNSFGIVDSFYDKNIDHSSQYHDNLNAIINVSGGVPLIADDYNLRDQILSYYPSRNEKINQDVVRPTFESKGIN
ncbi:Mhp366/Mhp367 family surface (lipo)protein [Mesomycoplasma conjunctivae]|uniref:Mhp366/Mhp367 family surface (lipo)protein n=1 Tax=Mesomycoplasma conjunctivae TaxID=45361 RepID=UPI003DA65CA3